MTPLASGLTPDEYWGLPPEKRPAASVSDPRAVFAFTAVSLRIVLESFLLRDELERLLAEIKRHVLHDEKGPYLRQALDRMAQTARLLFGIRRDVADECTPARRIQKSNWKRELRITTGRAIHFGGSVYGGSYVEAAMMLADGVVAAVCAMMPNQVNDIDDISEFLPRMPAPNEFPLLEYSIEKTVETINAVRLEWPDYDTFQHLCVDEFLETVERLELSTPNGQPWLDFILTRGPSETPPDDAIRPGSDVEKTKTDTRKRRGRPQENNPKTDLELYRMWKDFSGDPKRKHPTYAQCYEANLTLEIEGRDTSTKDVVTSPRKLELAIKRVNARRAARQKG